MCSVVELSFFDFSSRPAVSMEKLSTCAHNLNIEDFVQRKPKYAIVLCLEKLKEKPLEEILQNLHFCCCWCAFVVPSGIQSCWSFIRQSNELHDREEPKDGRTRILEEFAEALHALADKLPLKGFQLDVFWFIPDHSSVRVDQNIAILGALKRLHAWHGAQISILQVNDHRSSLNDWLSLLEARYIITSNRIDTTLRDVQNQTVWRGYLKLSEGKNSGSLLLPGFQLSTQFTSSSVPLDASRNRQIVKGMFILNDWIEVLDIVHLDQIPRSLLLTQKMELSIPASGILPRSFQFLSWLTSHRAEKLAIIAQLHYGTCIEGVSSCASTVLGTVAWKQQLAKNPLDFSVPEIIIKSDHGCEYLLLYSGPSGQCIVQSFVSLSMLNGQVIAQVAEMTSLGHFRMHNNLRRAVHYPLKGIPMVPDDYFLKFVNMFGKYNIQGFLYLQGRRLSRGYKLPATAKEIRFLFSLILSRLLSYSPLHMNASTSVEGRCLPVTTLQSDTNAEVVPERLALINQEHVREKKKREMNELQLAGMVVPPPVHNTVTLHLNAAEFLKHFHPNGLPIGQDFSPIGIATRSQLHISTPSKHTTQPNLKEEELKSLEFSDSLKYNLPGIHYCIDQETINTDARLSRLTQRVVTMETASTCSYNATTSVIKFQRDAGVTRPTSNRKVKTPRKSKVKSNSKSPRHLKRSQVSLNGGTPKKWYKASADSCSSVDASAQLIPKKKQNQGNEETEMPRKSQRLSTPDNKSLSGGITRRKSERLSATPKKMKGEGTLWRLKEQEIPRRKDEDRTQIPRRKDEDRTQRSSQNVSARCSSLRRESAECSNLNQMKEYLPKQHVNLVRKNLQHDGKRGRRRELSRSEKHKRKLVEIVNKALDAKGVNKSVWCYKKCFTRLYELSKSYIKDLKSSRGLFDEMEKVVESNVDFVVKFEMRGNS